MSSTVSSGRVEEAYSPQSGAALGLNSTNPVMSNSQTDAVELATQSGEPVNARLWMMPAVVMEEPSPFARAWSWMRNYFERAKILKPLPLKERTVIAGEKAPPHWYVFFFFFLEKSGAHFRGVYTK